MLDRYYFSDDEWKTRIANWLKAEEQAGNANPFLDGNVHIIRQIMEHPETGLRMVINISADSLLSFLAFGRYMNLYEQPVIGGKRRTPSPERIKVDALLGLGPQARSTYFGAVALGGTGVRFYGEYCMVLRPEAVAPNTPLFDRDSYDLLMAPLSDLKAEDTVRRLRGTWTKDVIDMLTLKLLPELRHANQLITTGTVSELALHDQEFVEVHRQGSITPDLLEEVRQSPDEVALDSRILARMLAGFPLTGVELRWRQQRERVIQALGDWGIRYRIVTLHGRGYQWR
jgi:hypothetical protein